MADHVTITLGVQGQNDVVLAVVEDWIERTGHFREVEDRGERVEDAIVFLLGYAAGAWDGSHGR